jgi:hypothetical protein
MTWRNDRSGLSEVEMLDGTVFDVIVEYDDARSINASDRVRATLVGSMHGYAHTSFEAKERLADQLERVAKRIRAEARRT